MKNRYGMDGMTYYATVDVSTGHIEIEDTPREIDESPVAPKQAFANDYSERDKGTLNKFFQNSTNSA